MMFKFYLYKFGQFCVNRLPLKVSYAIACFMSDCQYWFSFRDRRHVRNNLRVILSPGQNINAVTREVFRNFGKYLVEFFWMAREANEQFIQSKVRVENVHYIDEAKKKGKGVILCTAHIGNWELGAVIISKLGYKAVAVALPHKERPVNDLFNQQRESRGLTVVPISVAVRRCLETLKQNGIVAVVGDRDFTSNGVEMDFLGKKTLLPKGPALFAIKSGAALVPTFFIRNEDDTFTLTLSEPVYPETVVAENHIAEEALVVLMKRYISVIEAMIRRYPGQWLMFRPYWIRN
jgi:KDO2-lipid IV(A) lauroyltransferase